MYIYNTKVGLYCFTIIVKIQKIMIIFVGIIFANENMWQVFFFIHTHNFFRGLSPCHSFQESYLESHTAKKKE